MFDYRIPTFLMLAETKSYTETAKKLNISQPAVTQQIQSLQSEIGVELVRYSKRQLSLTEDGQYLASELAAIQPKMKEIYHRLEKKQEKIRVGCGKTLGEYLLFEPGFSLNTLLQNDEIDLSVDTTFHLLKQLDNFEIEMAIVAGEFSHEPYITYPYVKQRLIGISSPQNIMAKNATTLDEIKNENLFLREEGSGVHSILKGFFEREHVSLSDFRNTHEIANIPVIKNLVKQNHGVSFLLESSVKEELANGQLTAINLNEIPELYFYIVIRKEDQHQQAIQAVINKLI